MKHRNIALKSALLAAAIGCAGLASAQSTDGTISGEALEGQTIVLRVSPDGSVQSQTATVLVNRTTKIK